MPRTLLMLASAVLLLCAGLLVMIARESEASARVVAQSCVHAALGKAADTERALLIDKWPADIRHCTYVRRWDMTLIAFAGFALAGGLGFLAIGMSRQQRPA